ncbi:MAG TPA: tetratricopeptide repeat protein [Pyrinomonadaceae bacterium]
MQKHILTGIVGLVVGLIGGFAGANALNRNYVSQPAQASPQQAVAPQQTTGGSQPLPDVANMLLKAESEPQNFAVQMRTGDMYARIGRFEQAIEFYKKGISLRPQDFNANVVLANAYFDSGAFDNAAEYYSKALALNPSDVNARTDLGATYVERAAPDYDRAIKEFTTTLESDPTHAPSLYYLAVAQFRKGDVAEAQKTLSRLERTNPNSDLVERLRQNIASK